MASISHLQMADWINLDREAFLDSVAVDSNAVVIDVRSDKEYRSGHISGAINIPFTDRASFSQLDRNKSYYLYCQSGGRSGVVASFLQKASFPKIINLNDGIQYWPEDELSPAV